MKAVTTGTLTDGVVKLDGTVDLSDHSRVRVAIETLEDTKTRFSKGLKAWKQLGEEHPIHSGGKRYTRDELHERG